MSERLHGGSPSRWSRWRFAPLAGLMVLVVSATVLGVAAGRIGTRPADPAPIAPAALPDSCHPRVDAPPVEPWIADRAASEATWVAHSADLSEAYVRGVDGWVFWGDIQAANFSQAIGRRTLDSGELSRWHEYFAGIRDELAAQKIPFYIVVAPAKWDVYPERLPVWAQDLRGSVSLDQLLANGRDLPIVDLRASLRRASSEYPTYSATNSHWTDYGAWVGWRSITECIRATNTALGGVREPEISGVDLSEENNEFAQFGVESAGADWSRPRLISPLPPVTVTSAEGVSEEVDGAHVVGLEDLPVTTVASSAQSSASALVLRDSFGVSLSPFLDHSFATTFQVRHNIDGAPGSQPSVAALVADRHPDVVIYEIAERHLNFPPVH